VAQENARRKGRKPKSSAQSKDRASSAQDRARLAELAQALTALKVNTAELLERKKQLQNVDVALYDAKSAGRGTFAVFEPERDKMRGKRHFTAVSTIATVL
jgi:hypothetical protein